MSAMSRILRNSSLPETVSIRERTLTGYRINIEFNNCWHERTDQSRSYSINDSWLHLTDLLNTNSRVITSTYLLTKIAVTACKAMNTLLHQTNGIKKNEKKKNRKLQF